MDDGSVLRCFGETGIEKCHRFDEIASDDSRAVTNSVVMAIWFDLAAKNLGDELFVEKTAGASVRKKATT